MQANISEALLARLPVGLFNHAHTKSIGLMQLRQPFCLTYGTLGSVSEEWILKLATVNATNSHAKPKMVHIHTRKIQASFWAAR